MLTIRQTDQVILPFNWVSDFTKKKIKWKKRVNIQLPRGSIPERRDQLIDEKESPTL